uniref:Uncharacterized protein n=1 Tax=Vitis vinifera TaxID=29760 RepID=A5BLB7_VITVI|nr:hypothetical protein VITISV_037322 [Vitis vinifera]
MGCLSAYGGRKVQLISKWAATLRGNNHHHHRISPWWQGHHHPTGSLTEIVVGDAVVRDRWVGGGRGPWQAVVITCKTCLLQSMIRIIILGWLMLGHPDVFVESVRMFYAYKCRLNFLETVRIQKARHVYPDEGDPDGNACHVSP